MAKQKVILNLPYYSQYSDIKDKVWQSRSCGIVCLKMVMEYFGRQIKKRSPSISHMIKENEFINGFGKFGSNHESLVIIARNYGFHSYRQEFKSLKNDLRNKKILKSSHENELIKGGIKKLVDKLNNKKPIIVSVVKNFSESDKFHMIVLTGFEKSNDKIIGFYYNDPDYFKKSDGINRFVPIETFVKYWRKLSIFVNI